MSGYKGVNMTERAKEREEYKKKKRLPAPEKPKKRLRSRGDKPIVLMMKMRDAYIEKFLDDQDKNDMIFSFFTKYLDRSWHMSYRKYATVKDAKKALKILNKKENMFMYKLDDTITQGEK